VAARPGILRAGRDRLVGDGRAPVRLRPAAARPASGPEDRVIERIALAQIWPCLRPAHREALLALAAHGDYGLAARALGKPYSTFKADISRARREFLKLWHEGEAPSRPWVRDRRAGPGTDMHSLTYFLRHRRKRAQRATAGANTGL
jgi:hypothetical protein